MRPPWSVVLVAAGRGTRLGLGQNKCFLRLGDKPLAVYSLQLLEQLSRVGQVIVVVGADEVQRAQAEWVEAYGLTKVSAVVGGGEERQDSVRAGLAALAADARWVAVHDAARPFASAALWNSVLNAAEEHGAAVPGLVPADTIHQATGGQLAALLDRSNLLLAQTPQAFRRDWLQAAQQRDGQMVQAVTDDAGLVHAAGFPVRVVPGDAHNRKITWPSDLSPVPDRPTALPPLRVGSGYDVHAFAEGRPLVLGGVEIPSTRGLLGHSDADVLTHALMDALLGAVGQMDIGHWFPDDDPAYANANSLRLLGRVMELLRSEAWQVINADLTLLAEAPKVAPYVPAMRRRLAEVLGVAPACIAIKATTQEGLGFVGRGEGIAALATVLVGGSGEGAAGNLRS